MLGQSRLIQRSLFTSICMIWVCITAFSENQQHTNLFSLYVTDKKPSKILDFLSEVGIKNPYHIAGVNISKQSRTVFKDMINHVYEFNPNILSAREDVGIANEGRKQAFGEMLPKVNSEFSGTTNREKQEPGGVIVNDDFISGGLNVTQPLFRGGTLYKDYRKSKDELKAAEFAEESITQNLFLEAITSHLDVLESLAVAAVSKHSRDVFQKLDVETHAKLKSGLVTRVDRSQSTARLKGAQADYEQAVADYKKARKSFERIVGFPAVAAANIPDIQFKELADFDAIEKIVLVQHPSIRQAQKELDAAKNEIESKFGVLLPSADFIVGGAKNFKRGKQPTRYSGEAKFQVDFPVFSGGVDYSGYKQAQIEYRRALHQLDVVRRDVRDNLNATRYDYEIAQKIINARIEAVKASKVAFIGTRKELSVGEKSVLDTLDAETDFLEANISYINANFSRKKLIFQYLDAMGCLNYSVLSRAIN